MLFIHIPFLYNIYLKNTLVPVHNYIIADFGTENTLEALFFGPLVCQYFLFIFYFNVRVYVRFCLHFLFLFLCRRSSRTEIKQDFMCEAAISICATFTPFHDQSDKCEIHSAKHTHKHTHQK